MIRRRALRLASCQKLGEGELPSGAVWLSDGRASGALGVVDATCADRVAVAFGQ